MASTRAAGGNRLLMIGALVLVVGVILVLLVLRGGGDDVQVAGAGTSGDPALAETAATTGEELPAATLTVEELAGSRLPLPLPVPEGSEAVALRASFVRGLAALPQPGDRVKVYRAPAPDEDAPTDGEASVDGEDATVLLEDVEVLALIGPLPTQNEGEVTFLVAVDEDEVPALLPIARDAELWFTLLPSEDDTAAEEAA